MSYTFQELFLEQLDELYSAEQQILSALPNVIFVTSSSELRDTFQEYLEKLKNHVKVLDEGYKEIKKSYRGNVSQPAAGMIVELDEVLLHGGNSSVKDAALIAMVQRLIHFKIAVYGTARTFARHLNYQMMDSLQRALNEEGEMDKALTHLAEGGIFSTGINDAAIRAKMYTA